MILLILSRNIFKIKNKNIKIFPYFKYTLKTFSTLPAPKGEYRHFIYKNKQCRTTYNVIQKRIRVTIVALEN